MTDYDSLRASKGPAYKDDQIEPQSHYYDPIDHGNGRAAGNSRRWGDASAETQDKVINGVRTAAKNQGLTEKETAIALSIVRAESGYNPDAAAGTTSASGLAQFTDSTGKDFGLKATDRFDITNNAEAFIKLFKKEQSKAQTLASDQRFKNVSDADKIYAFHHEGRNSSPDGIYKFLTDDKRYTPSLKKNINTYADKAQKVIQKPDSSSQKKASPEGHKTMGRPFILVGDKTDHGGVVVQGSPQTNVMGRPVARVGDRVTCPKKGHDSNNVIVSGDPTVIVEGRPVARHGDKAACGATLISSQVSTTAPG